MKSAFPATRLRLLWIGMTVLAIVSFPAWVTPGELVDAQEPAVSTSGIQDFRLVSSNEGWLLINNQLFWTEDNGDSWINITPANAQSRTIATVFFLDPEHAWVGFANPGALLSNFVLERTDDGGVTWQIMSSNIAVPAGAIPLSNTVHMQMLDARTGWLLFEESTGSSFDAGRLFKTADGGATWRELTSPVGQSVYFASATLGWAVGRDGNGLYLTRNGGVSWKPTDISGAGDPANTIRQYGLPTFDTANNGLISVLVQDTSGGRAELRLYSTRDGGASWSLIHQLALAPAAGALSHIPLDLIDSGHAVVLLPHNHQILTMLDKQAYRTQSTRDGLINNIVKLDMLDMASGWAAWSSRHCASSSGLAAAKSAGGVVQCATETRLLRTQDGAATWTSIPLPAGISALTSETISLSGNTLAPSATVAGLPSTQVFVGQGFDSCTPPTLSEMQDWWSNSPYGVWNLYIGGSNRGCKIANQAITASFVSQLYQQGWRFIPAWVGLQAPCSELDVYTMSSDPTTAYNQGVAEADAASDTVADLGFANTILYFDLEYFPADDAACLAAAQSFISGWTARLHSNGDQAAVYGSACGSGLDNYYGIPNVPDAIWPAFWELPPRYDGSASVWGIPCIPDSHWSSHQRIRQYAGDHDETWGGTTINIDSDVLDGIVALPGANCSNPAPDSTHIALYSEDNYCGSYTVLGVGDYANASVLGVADNSVSSIRVGSDVEATLCTGDNYTGTCQNLATADVHLGNNSVGDNQVSSAKVLNRLQLVSPADAASVLSRRPPFDWTDVTGASAYNIQVSRTTVFTTLVRGATVPASTYTPVTDLPAGTLLYWRARAKIGGVYHSWSEVQSFKTPVPPSIPVLKSPATGALRRDYTPPLDWYDSSLPLSAAYDFDHYELQLATNTSFTTDVLDYTTALGVRTASNYTIPDADGLAPNRTYYWRVRSYDTGGEYSSWSARWAFRTAILPPTLASPPNVGLVASRRPVFDWQDVVGASGYKLQISKTVTFNTVLMQTSVVTSTFTPLTNLPAGTTLYWRVQANGPNGPSRWSAVWQFTTP